MFLIQHLSWCQANPFWLIMIESNCMLEKCSAPDSCQKYISNTILREQRPRAKQSNLPDNNLLRNRDFQLPKTCFNTKVTINRSQVTMHEWMCVESWWNDYQWWWWCDFSRNCTPGYLSPWWLVEITRAEGNHQELAHNCVQLRSPYNGSWNVYWG